METIFATRRTNLTKNSIFLAGPTPRSDDVPSWRPEALKILESMDFNGQVLIPENEGGGVKNDYMDQVEWEFWGLENCGCICIWVPRDMKTMPALTTNIEFGRYVGLGRVHYGRPDGAPHTSYLDWLYHKLNDRYPWPDLANLLFACTRQAAGDYNK